jgi:hypothetical protein
MTGPDGSMTNRDNRRNARRAQFEMRQTERHRERERRIRQQRLQRYAIVGGGIIAFLLLSFLIIHAVIGSGGASTPPHHGSYTTPANGASWERFEYPGIEDVVVAADNMSGLSGTVSFRYWGDLASAGNARVQFVMRSSANQRMME